MSVRWNFDEEKFFKKLNWNWVDYSAIRASWGRVVKYKATKYDVWGNYLLGSDTYNGNTVIPIDFENMPNNNIDPIRRHNGMLVWISDYGTIACLSRETGITSKWTIS